MGAPPDLDPTTLVDRIVLLGVIKLVEGEGVTPNSNDVRACCSEEIQRADLETFEHPSEPDIARSLRRLVDVGLLEEVMVETGSVVGKGRPRFDLAVDSTALLAALGEDDRLDPLVDEVAAVLETQPSK